MVLIPEEEYEKMKARFAINDANEYAYQQKYIKDDSERIIKRVGEGIKSLGANVWPLYKPPSVTPPPSSCLGNC